MSKRPLKSRLWPRRESNLGLELRKLLYYPLYYEACNIAANVIVAAYSCFNCANIRSVSSFLHNSVPAFRVAAVPAATP
jgi:hypothetical protein